MVNFGQRQVSKESTTQLPVSWYFDSGIYEAELNVLFQQGTNYVGHESMVPNVGDYYVLPWRENAQVLVRNQHGVELLSNVCRHRQVIMLDGQSNTRNIVCPLHRWSYDLEGKLIGAPFFSSNPCLNLKKTPLQNWNGLLFDVSRDVTQDISGLHSTENFDFSGYVLDRVQIDDYPINWKTFMEVFQDNYHVLPRHPGLKEFVDCDDFQWELGDQCSVHSIGLKNNLSNSGTPVYERWSQAVRAQCGNETPRYGGIWLAYYPNLLIEWFPDALVVNVVLPRSPVLTTVMVSFYYPKEIFQFKREFVEAQQAALMETAAEDDEIAFKMTEGRRVLHLAGDDDAGPYQVPLEDGVRHFHSFLRRKLEAYS